MVTKPIATALGALTGAIPLVAMLRLLAGVFGPQLERVAFVAVLLALLPWIAYVAVRARRAVLSRRTALKLLLLDTAAVGLVSLFTIGPVLALALALRRLRPDLGARSPRTPAVRAEHVRPHRGPASRGPRPGQDRLNASAAAPSRPALASSAGRTSRSAT